LGLVFVSGTILLWNSQKLSAGSGTKALLEQVSASSSAAGTVQTLQSPLPPQDFTAFKNFDLEEAFG